MSLGIKSKTFLSRRVSTIILLCSTLTKSPRPMPTKRNSLLNLAFGIESDHFDSNHFHEVNKFVEDNYQYFYPPEDPDDYWFDVGNEHELVADVDAQTLVKLVKFLKRGKAPGPDTIHNEVLRLGTTTSLFHHLARLFTSSIQLGYIPTSWKLDSLCMLLKSDKPITLNY